MPTSDPGAEPALAILDVTKRFGSTLALDRVSFALRRGTVHALLGENGAGKTTLMRIAFGMLQPDGGTVRIGPRRIASTSAAIAAGVGMVHQHFTNVPAMTVAENVALGGKGRYDRHRAAQRVDEIGRRSGLVLDPSARAADLSVGAQQRLEIVKALARDASVLILDEPTAVLAPSESEELLRWVRRFADSGNSVVIITHKLREARTVADDVTILRHGRVVLSGSATGRTEDELAEAMLGAAGSADEAMRPEGLPGAIVARLRGVRVTDGGVSRLSEISLDVRGGEVLGVAAVEGAGQRELLRLLAGRLRPTDGSVELPDSVGFVPEDRHRDALVLAFDAAENVVLRGAGRRRGLIPWRRERERADVLIASYDVRGAAHHRRVGALSGGNQQKLVVGRELEGNPSLLVAENPTRGLDIRATRSVHQLIREVARRGGAVVVYSSDIEEVLSLATRVVALHGGRLTETSLDRAAIGRAILGIT